MAQAGTGRRLVAGERLVVASHNPGKVWEIRKLVAPFGLDVVSAGDLGLVEPDETETSFIGNARLKALAAARASGHPALADDSGLEVACLGGAPGIFSARWAGPTKDFTIAMRKVAEEVTARHGWTSPGPAANFICALCLAWPDGETRAFEGRIDGVLVWPARGSHGFGYDAMFLAEGHAITFGEMEPADKNAISHRARAFDAFRAACLGEVRLVTGLPTRIPTADDGLAAAARSVSSHEEFIRFVANLADDLSVRPDAWRNASLDRYLAAVAGYVIDSPAPPSEPVWRTLAVILYQASRHA